MRVFVTQGLDYTGERQCLVRVVAAAAVMGQRDGAEQGGNRV